MNHSQRSTLKTILVSLSLCFAYISTSGTFTAIYSIQVLGEEKSRTFEFELTRSQACVEAKNEFLARGQIRFFKSY